MYVADQGEVHFGTFVERVKNSPPTLMLDFGDNEGGTYNYETKFIFMTSEEASAASLAAGMAASRAESRAIMSGPRGL